MIFSLIGFDFTSRMGGGSCSRRVVVTSGDSASQVYVPPTRKRIWLFRGLLSETRFSVVRVNSPSQSEHPHPLPPPLPPQGARRICSSGVISGENPRALIFSCL